ncbi:MAG TPA: hypothetical protein VNI77_01210 [Nitrososphaera sp.]|nr:hypothetical protein [Nitrososphaera sp.]
MTSDDTTTLRLSRTTITRDGGRQSTNLSLIWNRGQLLFDRQQH